MFIKKVTQHISQKSGLDSRFERVGERENVAFYIYDDNAANDIYVNCNNKLLLLLFYCLKMTVLLIE